MKIKKKLARIDAEIESIAGHDDEDSAVVVGALEKVKASIDAKIERIKARNAADLADLDKD
jgi:hypothetical protein